MASPNNVTNLTHAITDIYTTPKTTNGAISLDDEPRQAFSFWVQDLSTCPPPEPCGQVSGPGSHGSHEHIRDQSLVGIVNRLKTDGALVPMQHKDVHTIESMLHCLEQELDIWERHFNPAVFCRYFKSLKYKPTVDWVFNEVRNLVRHSLRRTQPAFNSEQYRVRFIQIVEDLGPENTTLAFVPTGSRAQGQRHGVVDRDIFLLPAMFQPQCPLPAFAFTDENRLLFSYDGLKNVGPLEYALFHEAVHVVTIDIAARAIFSSLSGLKTPLRGCSVNDMDVAAVARKNCDVDQAVIEEARRLSTPPKNSKLPAYGPKWTQALAKLTHGAEASLQNADSYAWFLHETVTDFLIRALDPHRDAYVQRANATLMKAFLNYAMRGGWTATSVRRLSHASGRKHEPCSAAGGPCR